MATRRDLDHAIERIEARFDAKLAGVDTKFAGVDAKFAGVDARFDRLEAKVDGAVAQMATKADLDEPRSDLQRTLVAWILTAQATVVAAVVGLVAVLG